jgi:hypothetical protein
MGNTHTANVDVAALGTIADRFDDAAVLIERAARGRLGFDGASAGRAHAGHGDQWCRIVETVLTDLSVWARAAAEVGTTLRVGARRYRDADQAAAGGI